MIAAGSDAGSHAARYGAGVDDELRELERAQAADPADPTAAERLKAALLRAGRRDEVQRRYKLGFVCEARWDEMPRRPGARGDVRHCLTCRRDVHLARSYADFDRLAAQGHCVTAYPHELPRVLDGLVDASGRSFTRGEGPCLVEGPEEPPAEPFPRPLGGAPARIDPPPERPAGLVAWIKGLLGG
jgi:hypothetical protein